MENDQVFSAEAVLDHGQVKAADRNISSHEHQSDDNENRPLLTGSHQNSSHDDGDFVWQGQKYLDELQWYRRPSIIWLLPPFLLFTLAFGGTIVPKLNIILNLICRDYICEQVRTHPGLTIAPVILEADNPQCRIPEVQARVARFTLYMSFIAGILSAIISPKLGALSDRYGRKPIIAFTTIGFLVGETVTILVGTYPNVLSVNWFLAAAVVEGLSGSFIATLAICHSYATDCTAPYKRHVAFGRFHGCLFAGIALGPVLAAYIIKWSGNILSVFYAAIAGLIIFILFLALCIPESLSADRQRAAREKFEVEQDSINSVSGWKNRLTSFNLLEPLKILYPKGSGNTALVRRNLILLALIDFCCFGVAMGSMTVVVIYSNYQFGWDSIQSSFFLSVVNSCRVICLVFVLPVISKIFRDKFSASRQQSPGSDMLDLYIIRCAIFIDALGYLGYAMSQTGTLFIFSGAIAAIGGIGSPTLQSSLTKHVSNDKTGQLLGATGLLHAVARVLGPVIFSGIYSLTVGIWPRAVFVCLSATFLFAHLLSYYVRPYVYLEKITAECSDNS